MWLRLNNVFSLNVYAIEWQAEQSALRNDRAGSFKLIISNPSVQKPFLVQDKQIFLHIKCCFFYTPSMCTVYACYVYAVRTYVMHCTVQYVYGLQTRAYFCTSLLLLNIETICNLFFILKSNIGVCKTVVRLKGLSILREHCDFLGAVCRHIIRFGASD